MHDAPRFPDEFNLAHYFLFDRVKEGLGDKVAIRWGERGYTYREVAERSLGVAAHLTPAAVRGHRVYIVLPDGPAFAWSFFRSPRPAAAIADAPRRKARVRGCGFFTSEFSTRSARL